MTHVHAIAMETAGAIVERLTGASPDAVAIERALAAQA
jgi:hypothetical protein